MENFIKIYEPLIAFLKSFLGKSFTSSRRSVNFAVPKVWLAKIANFASKINLNSQRKHLESSVVNAEANII
jgi:hypothetical protein